MKDAPVLAQKKKFQSIREETSVVPQGMKGVLYK